MTKKPRNYVNNKSMLEAVTNWRAECQEAASKGLEPPRMPDYLGTCIMQICEGTARRPNFSGYSYVMEMKLDAQVDCVRALKNFDPTISQNPFGYVGRCAWNAMVRRIQSEKQQQYIKHSNFTTMLTHGDASQSSHDALRKHLEYSQELVADYDRRAAESREKKRQSLIERRLEEAMAADIKVDKASET